MLTSFRAYFYIAGLIALIASYAVAYRAGRNSVFNEQAQETIRSVKDAKQSDHEIERLGDDATVASLFGNWGI